MFMALQIWGFMYAISIVGSIMFAVIPIMAKILAGILLGEKSTLIENIFVSLSVASLIFMIVMGAGELTFSIPGVIQTSGMYTT